MTTPTMAEQLVPDEVWAAIQPPLPPKPPRPEGGRPWIEDRAVLGGGAVGLSAANPRSSLLLEPMVDAVPAVIGPRGRPGRPRKRPAMLHADNGYDYPWCRRTLRRRAITCRVDILTALLHLACPLICARKLKPL
jgi:hypothetical protein